MNYTMDQIMGATAESLQGMSRAELLTMKKCADAFYCRAFDEAKAEGTKTPAFKERMEATRPILQQCKLIEEAYDATFEPWEKLFSEWSAHAEGRIFFSLEKPSTISTLNSVKHYDESAAHVIAECEKLITKMKSYRTELARRYGEIATTPTIPGITLERRIDYYDHNHVYFELTTYTRPSNSQEYTTSNMKRFEGRERREAIAEYKSYIRSHPGIEHKTNIDNI